MSEARYKYNTRTLSYEKVEAGFSDKVLRFFSYLATGLVFGALFTLMVYMFVDSPKERMLKRENADLLLQYEIMNKKLAQMETVQEDMETRDNNIYRTLFGTEPIPSEVRQAGYGGVNRYKHLEKMSNSDLVVNTNKRLDRLAKRMYIQSKSFDEVVDLAEEKEDMLAAVPAIQPISNKDLTRMASGYGNRVDPIYGTPKFHAGMDFTAPTGTEIYATGNGKVIQADSKSRGYGRHVRVSHGFGYVTLYAHMSKILVKPGQKVKRGDVIGLVGCTGKCVGPHLHYEVRKNGDPINPINFYFNDLSPEEYDKMLELSTSAMGQSLD